MLKRTEPRSYRENFFNALCMVVKETTEMSRDIYSSRSCDTFINLAWSLLPEERLLTYAKHRRFEGLSVTDTVVSDKLLQDD